MKYGLLDFNDVREHPELLAEPTRRVVEDTAQPAQTKIEREEEAQDNPDASDEVPVSQDETTDETALSCEAGETLFSDKDFGAAFCYPAEWGNASVMDAKIDTADTGHREAVRFTSNTNFIVGGVSDDWTTTVGRDVACQEPSNQIAELSSYNTEWHNIVGEGMAVEFAQRSLVSSQGGYDMVESASGILDFGVCVQGHKVINGSRYRVISAAYYEEFSEASGIASPKAHMDNPNVLFTAEQRTQIDALMASIVAY
jgi:hypothetical protein